MSAPTAVAKRPPAVASGSRAQGLASLLGIGLLYYALTSLLVLFGIRLAEVFFPRPPEGLHELPGPLRPFIRWDGNAFARIAVEGYTYISGIPSPVSYFPAYPLLGRAVTWLTSLGSGAALMLVSHLCLATSFVLAAAYAGWRSGGAPAPFAGYVLAALGLLPNTYIFRVVYSESLFLLLVVLALYAMERRLPLLLIALVVGLATATRPVGVGLFAPLLLHLWHRSPTVKGFLARAGLLLPLACWGLAAYMGYLYVQFDEPLAFAKSQQSWTLRSPNPPLDEKLMDLAELEPIAAVFSRSSPGYWEYHESHDHPLFSLCVANPVFFLLAVALIALGAYMGWLSSYEILLAVPLLLIPYVMRGHDYMAGASRMAAVVFPIYLVLGHLLCRLPAPLAGVLLSLSGFLLAVQAAMFTSAPRYLLI